MKRHLGRSGIEISALGMGCWTIGGPLWSGETPLSYGEVDDAESTRAIHAALDLGVNFFDTANLYGAGHSERVLGKAIAGHRPQAIIATKFNAVFDETTRRLTGADPSPEGIRAACEASLRRLNINTIDLYQFHNTSYPVVQALLVRETLEELVKEGKIRAYGWSTDYPDRAELFAQGKNCAAIQFQLNVLDENPAMTAICECYNLGAINRGPLAKGLLTGKYTSATKVPADDVRGERAPNEMKYFYRGLPNPVWLEKCDAVREIICSEGRTAAQGALAWLWAHSPQNIPIPGFRTVEQVKENAGAMRFGPLKQELMREIDEVLERQ